VNHNTIPLASDFFNSLLNDARRLHAAQHECDRVVDP
jgi:hypothetical protein